MNNQKLHLNIILIFSLIFTSDLAFAQLGFCQGNSGDPIFVENFGTGLTDSPLPPGTTTYNYANGADPDDGLYTVSSNTDYFDWFDIQDHTPGDVNGRMLIVNSSFSAGEFYRTTINGLCENTSYEFSSWIVNLTPASGFCGAGAIPVNVRFEIWDDTDTNLLASGNTGNIGSTNSPNWQQYGLVFQTIPAQTSVILKMINNGSGGCGNDLAIDDIVFKSCGDFISVTDPSNNTFVSLCSSETPYSTTLIANPDNSVFNDHFYQWQESADDTIWTDIPGATNSNLVLSGVTTTTYYRAKVAEFASNLNNNDCITYSSTFIISITQLPNPPIIECWEVASVNNATCSWEVSGTQPPEPTGLECWETTNFNTSTCSWEISGTQPVQPTLECWETANFNSSTCSWDVTGTQPEEPVGLECWETTTFNSTSCLWEVTGTQPVEPVLECWETATFNASTCSWDVTGTQPAEPVGIECWETATFNTTTCLWEVTGTNPNINSPSPLEYCDTDNDGIGQFDLTIKDIEITGGNPNLLVSYHETIADANNDVNPLASPYTNIIQDIQTVFVRVEISSVATNCAVIEELTLIVNP
ncbi:MAG: hypothetical protein KDD05_06475, partial [Psychroserpens sp.]|nr:hypothetical protein [Psychroserpens sp.]